VGSAYVTGVNGVVNKARSGDIIMVVVDKSGRGRYGGGGGDLWRVLLG